ncbi:unnamed protein product, partial [Symbiodinium natans]
MNASLPWAQAGLRKKPLPNSMPAATQLSVRCNASSRMFVSGKGEWHGPRDAALFTCVSGEWLGEPGPWQSWENYSCLECIQIGTPSLQRLTSVSMPEVYYLEHRKVLTTYGRSMSGCATASAFTASPLHSSANPSWQLDMREKLGLTSAAASSTKWWISTTDRTLRYTPRDCVSCTSCVCGASLHELGPCRCQSIQAKWILDDDFRLKQGADCAFLNIDKLDISACPAGLDSRYLWYFSGGDCIFGYDMVDTSRKTWEVSTVSNSGTPLKLTQIKYVQERLANVIEYKIAMAYDELCLSLAQGEGLCDDDRACRNTLISRDCQQSFYMDGDRIGMLEDGKNWYLKVIRSRNDNAKWLLVAEAFNESEEDEFRFGRSDDGLLFTRSEKVSDDKCLTEIWLPTSRRLEERSYPSDSDFVSVACDSSRNEMINANFARRETGNPNTTTSGTCMSLSRGGVVLMDCHEISHDVKDLPGPGINMTCTKEDEVLQSWQVEHQCSRGVVTVRYTCCRAPIEAGSCRRQDGSINKPWLANANCQMGVLRSQTLGSYCSEWDAKGPFSHYFECCDFKKIPDARKFRHDAADVTLEHCGDSQYFPQFQSWHSELAPPSICSDCAQLSGCHAALSCVQAPPNFDVHDGACESLSPEAPPGEFDPNANEACSQHAWCLGYFLLNEANESAAGMLFRTPVLGNRTRAGYHCFVKKVSTETMFSQAIDLNLEVLQKSQMSPKQQQAYQRVLAPKIQESRKSPRVLFACPPSQEQETLCAEDAPLSVHALNHVIAQGGASGLKVEATCPVLVTPSSTIAIGKAMPTTGMTVQEIYNILQSQAYYSTFFGSPLPPPFNSSSNEDAERVGFLSLPPTGVGIWGLRCPDGA